MAVRLREADNIAAMAELQQHISELEIQVKSHRCAQAFGNCNVHSQLFVLSHGRAQEADQLCHGVDKCKSYNILTIFT